jgi:hypothetical protein
MSIEDMTMTTSQRDLVKTWKIQVTAKGVAITLNGQAFEVPMATAHSMLFDFERAVAGYAVPGHDEAKTA